MVAGIRVPENAQENDEGIRQPRRSCRADRG